MACHDDVQPFYSSSSWHALQQNGRGASFFRMKICTDSQFLVACNCGTYEYVRLLFVVASPPRVNLIESNYSGTFTRVSSKQAWKHDTCRKLTSTAAPGDCVLW